ncbi:MAG: MFS transporter [Candidatus Micrarchaeota archaeon]
MQKLKIINFIDGLIEASALVVIPLMLVARNVDVSSIGLVLAVSPLVFLFLRVVFASISDLVGLKNFFILNALSNIVSAASYLYASSPLGYSVGKLFEGVNASAIWAVNRTAVVQISKERDPSIDTARINGIRIIAFFVATVGIGYLLQLFSFEHALWVLALLGLLNLAISLSLKERPFTQNKLNLRRIASQLDVRKKPKFLIYTSIVMSLPPLAGSALFRLALPLYLQSQGFDYIEIGLLIGVQWLARGLTLFSAIKRLSMSQVALSGSVLLALPLIALPFAPPHIILLLMIVFGIGLGMTEIMWEKNVFSATKGSKVISTDIAIVQTLPNLASFLSLAIGGFIISWFGYWPIFLFSAVFYSAYLVLGQKLLHLPSK